MIAYAWFSLLLFLCLIKAQLCHLQIGYDSHMQETMFFKDILDGEGNNFQ